MGWVLMSERELRRIAVLSRVVEGSMTTASAAAVLNSLPSGITADNMHSEVDFGAAAGNETF
jgi:hypothetical protein